jgi:hypothetical protein
MSTIAVTPLGNFRKVNQPGPLERDWLFECPGCGEWMSLSDDQWRGRVSVDHASMGCPGRYHETHEYSSALSASGWATGVDQREALAGGDDE